VASTEGAPLTGAPRLPGVGGTLFPARFLAERAATLPPPTPDATAAWQRWWRGVAETSGPAPGPREVVDRVAMPLCARLGFAARDLAAGPAGGLSARLLTPRGQPVGLLVLGWRGWRDRPPAIWRDATEVARAHDAAWAIVIAPPYVTIVPARGHASRRAVDLALPEALEPATLALFTTVAGAPWMEGAGDEWIAEGRVWRDRLSAHLRDGVADAVAALTRVCGEGRGEPSAFDQALTVLYRVVFLLFAESRGLVPIDHPLYRDAYALTPLCHAALTHTPSGVWDALTAITALSRQGCKIDDLIVHPFNGRLFARQAAPAAEDAARPGPPTSRSRARDGALAETLRAIGTHPSASGRHLVSYADFGVEELGAIYERVIELEPGRPMARKDSGTYYTPQPLADRLVAETLAPLVDGRSTDELLHLRVVDPAMGSGAFLIAALRYLATTYERAGLAEGRWTPLEVTDERRAAFRRVIAQHCLYGVDRNPVAVQVARLSLWLATMAHGKPLSFLDHRLRVGDSLVGTTPAMVMRPLGARTHVLPLFDAMASDLEHTLRRHSQSLRTIGHTADDHVGVVKEKERLWAQCREATGLHRWTLAAHLWCAHWFWPERDAPTAREMRAAIDATVAGRNDLGGRQLQRWQAQATAAAATHRFFHWPLEFADVWGPDGEAGFDAVVGNPPWEMVRADRSSDRNKGAAHTQLVQFVRESGEYTLCGQGHLNLYQPFIERALGLCREGGRVGLIVPWGLAVDEGTTPLRSRLVGDRALDVVIGLDNRRGWFPIHRGVRMAAVVASRERQHDRVRARFGVATAEALEQDSEHVAIRAEDLARLSGPALRLPDIRDRASYEALRALADRFPPCGDPAGWGLQFSRELNATDDRPLMQDGQAAHGVPVIEGKHIEPFRVFVDRATRHLPVEVARHRLRDGRYQRPRLAYRDVSGVGNTRALIAAVIPAGVVTTHTLFCLRTPLEDDQLHYLCALFNSPICDAYTRLFMGSHVTTGLIEHMPLPLWSGSRPQRRIARLARARAAGHPAPDLDRLVKEAIYVPK
jgi:hypothetical protein